MRGFSCPKCGLEFSATVQLTRHHILPKRFYPGSWETIELCRSCHDLIETKIPVKKKMPDQFYYDVVNDFLGGKVVWPTNRKTLIQRIGKFAPSAIGRLKLRQRTQLHTNTTSSVQNPASSAFYFGSLTLTQRTPNSVLFIWFLWYNICVIS